MTWRSRVRVPERASAQYVQGCMHLTFPRPGNGGSLGQQTPLYTHTCNNQIYVHSSLLKNMNDERQPKKKLSIDSVQENIKCNHMCPETLVLYILII